MPPLDRQQLVRDARDIIAILDTGVIPGHPEWTDVPAAIARMAAGTALYTPDQLQALSGTRPQGRHDTRIHVTGETTLAAALRLLTEDSAPVAALNFASATTPGGGFLTGSAAQEESLCRATGLYGALRQAAEYYELHRAQRDPLYSHHMIYSQDVPILRDPEGTSLPGTMSVDVVTAAAPNLRHLDGNDAGMAAMRPPAERALAERARYVLALLEARRCPRVILGAWGAGAFRNDPVFVARTFRELLGGPFRGAFQEVIFAVFTMPWEQRNLDAFRAAFPDEVVRP